MAKPYLFASYSKRNSDKGLDKFKKAVGKKIELKEQKIPEKLITRVENEEKIKLTPRVYSIKGLYGEYGNTAIEHDKSIFIDKELSPEMRELAIYHELKEVAGREKGLSQDEAHINARIGELRLARDMGLKITETPEKYELNYNRQLHTPKDVIEKLNPLLDRKEELELKETEIDKMLDKLEKENENTIAYYDTGAHKMVVLDIKDLNDQKMKIRVEYSKIEDQVFELRDKLKELQSKE